ncbi:unnamed protein product [Closterium sp. NIES-54]
MEVARTSMIHAAAPHFLWPFAVRYAAHQLNLWPCVSLPETSPTLCWTREVGNASVFRDVTFDESVPFYRLFPYRSAPPQPPPLFLAPRPPPPGGAEPGGTASEGAGSGRAEPAGVEPGGVEPRGTASFGGPAGASPRLSPRPEPLSPQQLREWFAQRTLLWRGAAGARDSAAGDTGAGGVGATCLGGAGVPARAGCTGGAAAVGPRGARTRGTGAAGIGIVGGAGARGAGVEDPAEPRDAGAGGAGAGGTGAGSAGAGGAGAGDTGAVGAGGGGTSTGGAGAGGVGVGDIGAVDPGDGGAGARGAVSGGTGARGTQDSPPRAPSPYAEQTDSFGERREHESRLALPVCAVRTACRAPRPHPPHVPGTHAMPLCPSSVPLRVPLLPSPESFLPAAPDPESDLACATSPTISQRREPESCLALLVRAVCTACRAPRPRPPHVLGTHAMPLRPSSIPLRVSLPPSPESFLPAAPDPEFDLARATTPTISRLLATVVTDPSFESTTASALVAELVDFAAACRLDYATALVAESESANPPSVGGECALGTDVLENRQEDFECLAAAIPHLVAMLLALEGDPDTPDILTLYSSQWQTAMDAEMASWKSTGTYVDAVPPFGANIVDGKWILWVKRPPGSLPALKARYVARGFSQR